MSTRTRDSAETLPLAARAADWRAAELSPGVLVEPGMLLLQRFEIGAYLGAGGMGIVYEAHDRELEAPVALKFLHRSDPPALYRLKREFQAMNALGPHPNLVAPSGLFCDRGAWFVSMELVRGESWLGHTRPGDRLDLARLRRALAQLAQGLCAIHRAGKVHRDLKPSNVLISADGRLVILDFGLVSDRDLAAEPGSDQRATGTPRYMAPEQARCEPATEASDCYALGVMLYEALTGISPFERDSVEARAGEQSHDPASPALAAPELPRELVALCAALLARDPAARPTADAVLAALGQQRAPEPAYARGAPHRALVGRRSELAALRAALARIEQGLPRLVLIEGESAIGKSALVEAFVSRLPAGTVALASRCHVRADVPYKAWDDLIDELSGFLQRTPVELVRTWLPQDLDTLLHMFPVLDRVDELRRATGRAAQPCDPHELRRRGAAALRELLGRIAADRQMVLFVDDLQWGDADSATLLRELLCTPFAPALLFVGAYRVDARENSAFVRSVRELADEAGLELETLSLGPLQPQAARRLARTLLGERGDARLAAAIARETGGIPLFVHELSAQARNGLRDELPRGTALSAAIARRVQVLPPPARTVLELVSIAHAPLPESVILNAAELGTDAPMVVRALSAQSLLRVRGDGRLDVYHDRVRECVAERLPAERKRELDCALVQSLQRHDRAGPDVLAAHALSAGLVDVGLAATLRAAEDAMHKLAFERAAAHLRTALRLLGEDDPRRDASLVRLAEALALDGRGREAGDAYVQAAEGAAGYTRIARLRQASAMYLGSAYVDRGIDVMLPVLQTLDLAFPRSIWGIELSALYEFARVRLLGQSSERERPEAEIDDRTLARIDACYALGSGLLGIHDAGLSRVFMLRALRLALQAGAARKAAYVEVALGSVADGPAQVETRSLPVLERSYGLARRHGDKELEAWTHVCHGMAWVYGFRPATAIEHARLAQACLDAAGVFGGFTVDAGQHVLRIALMCGGRMAELATATAEHSRLARARSDLYEWTGAQTYGALATLAAGHPDRAVSELADAFETWTTGEHWQRWRKQLRLWGHAAHALLLRTQAETYRDNGAGAFAVLDANWSALKREGYLASACWRVHLFWARGIAALSAAQHAAAPGAFLADARRSVAGLRRIRTQPVAHAYAQLLESGLLVRSGDLPAARAALREAAEGFAPLHMDLFATAAQRRLGELTAGEPGEQLRTAADARMRALGVASPQRWAAMYAPGWTR